MCNSFYKYQIFIEAEFVGTRAFLNEISQNYIYSSKKS